MSKYEKILELISDEKSFNWDGQSFYPLDITKRMQGKACCKYGLPSPSISTHVQEYVKKAVFEDYSMSVECSDEQIKFYY
jgi:hypothetical protein